MPRGRKPSPDSRPRLWVLEHGLLLEGNSEVVCQRCVLVGLGQAVEMLLATSLREGLSQLAHQTASPRLAMAERMTSARQPSWLSVRVMCRTWSVVSSMGRSSALRVWVIPNVRPGCCRSLFVRTCAPAEAPKSRDKAV